MVEVILKKEVRKLGDRGQVVQVAPGYARNYLFPQGLAMPATAAGKRQLEEMHAAGQKEADLLTGDAKTTAETMDGVVIRLVEKAGDRGQLFGSVTNRDLAAALVAAGHEIDRHQIILDSPLKRVADYDVRIHLYRDVNVTVKVEVRAEGREDELFLDAPEMSEMEAMLTAAANAPAVDPDASVEEGSAEAEEGAEATAEASEEGAEAPDTEVSDIVAEAEEDAK